MAYVSYCVKCKSEIPVGEICPNCGKKLTKASERLSFGVVRRPVTDWFSWNAILRVALPAVLIALASVVVLELIAGGGAGLIALLAGGFPWLALGALAATGLIGLIALLCQGEESVHYFLDKTGANCCIYLKKPTRLKLVARLISPSALKNSDKEQENIVPGLTLISTAHIDWRDVRKARFWRENGRILLYKPRVWLYMPLQAYGEDYAQAEDMIRKKLGRKVPIFPAK